MDFWSFFVTYSIQAEEVKHRRRNMSQNLKPQQNLSLCCKKRSLMLTHRAMTKAVERRLKETEVFVSWFHDGVFCHSSKHGYCCCNGGPCSCHNVMAIHSNYDTADLVVVHLLLLFLICSTPQSAEENYKFSVLSETCSVI